MNTSKDAVHDYLNAMFMDAALSDAVIAHPPKDENLAQIQPLDTIPTGARMVTCFDPFQFLSLTLSEKQSNHWLAILLLINVTSTLPSGMVKTYCLNHCQILLKQWFNHA